MNDRYLCKAKDFATGNWHRGFLVNILGDECTICENGYYWACDSKTICQCTGLKDKNGKLIFENDIVANECSAGVVMFGEYDGNIRKNIGFFIEWGEEYYRQDLGYWANKIKVIGMVVE